MDHLLERLDRLGNPRVAVVGDFMLDRYVYGYADRLSPESPVPVLSVVKREDRCGGAANVAAAVAALGGRADCVGTIGADADGGRLVELLSAVGCAADNLVRLDARPTTVKTRCVGLAQHRHAQQMLRIDDEDASPLSADQWRGLRQAFDRALGDCDLVALEDYNKGTLHPEHTPALIEAARSAGKAVVVDPARVSDYARYRGCSLLTPNRYEAELVSGMRIEDERSLAVAARRVIESAAAEAVVITLDKEGCYVATRDGASVRVPTRPRQVYDVTGAGDQVLAMLAVALAGGCSLEEAAGLANLAGGLEVERFGVVAITRGEVADELRRMVGLRGSKVMDRQALALEVRRRQGLGQTVVFTNGCFDLLHMGHVRYLRQAREMGHCLVVAINSDASVRRLKGPSRPVIAEGERAEMLAALECVDHVTVFDEDTPCELLELLRPDVLVKGGTTPVVVGREIVEGYGGRVLTTAAVQGLSTTQIIERIVGQGNTD
ncbi:MAG: Bifunctional protein HldE [Planctomycetes bacterium ADurb.Bin126]|nr:MAG: Bifunctional protein HldE [Planctomycetes bacterium ADurb.Bin126]HOD82743.1 D-glycero-beta-D-manno-heptose 1-phosphate adenylyltransferase [Phycisphaerae bacterium]HQL73378.1 D-glycero-beta-D-manno-heptose 1-phosphate adenylyltransferase [Phycisphaerae bacterium]